MITNKQYFLKDISAIIITNHSFQNCNLLKILKNIAKNWKLTHFPQKFQKNSLSTVHTPHLKPYNVHVVQKIISKQGRKSYPFWTIDCLVLSITGIIANNRILDFVFRSCSATVNTPVVETSGGGTVTPHLSETTPSHLIYHA